MRLVMTLFLVCAWCSCKILKPSDLKTETITIDYADFKKSKIVKKARKGALVQLEIKNINRNQYTVQINNSQTDFFTNQPAIFTSLNTNQAEVTQETFTKNITGSSFASGSSIPDLKVEIQGLNDRQREFNDYLTEFGITLEEYKVAIQAIKQSSKLKSVLSSISQDCTSEINLIIADANTQAIAFVSQYQTVLGSNVGTTQPILKGQIKIILEYYLSDAERKFKKLKSLNEKIEEVVPELQSNIHQVISKLKLLLQQRIISLPKKADLESKMLIVEKIERTVKTDYKRETQIMQSAIESNLFVELYSNTNEMTNIINLYGLFTENHYTFTHTELIEKDELLFNLEIRPTPNSQCPMQTYRLPVRVRANGGFKLDFSSGLFINFGKNDFFNQTYRLDDIEGDPNHFIVAKNKNRNAVIPSLGALLHGYIRTGGELQPALSLGVSLSAGETSRLNYHLGPSLLIGKEQRLVASIGWTIAEAVILDGKYQDGQIIPKVNAPDALPLTTYYRSGHFFSLNYNLTR